MLCSLQGRLIPALLQLTACNMISMQAAGFEALEHLYAQNLQNQWYAVCQAHLGLRSLEKARCLQHRLAGLAAMWKQRAHHLIVLQAGALNQRGVARQHQGFGDQVLSFLSYCSEMHLSGLAANRRGAWPGCLLLNVQLREHCYGIVCTVDGFWLAAGSPNLIAFPCPKQQSSSHGSSSNNMPPDAPTRLDSS